MTEHQEPLPASSPVPPGVLPDERHEAFCRHLAAGQSPAASARLAGYAWHGAGRHAHALLGVPAVSRRVAQLAVARQQHDRQTRGYVVARIKRVVQSSFSQRNDTLALRALGLLGRVDRDPVMPAARTLSMEDGDDSAFDPAEAAIPAPAPAMPDALPAAVEPLFGLVPAVIPAEAVDEKGAAMLAVIKQGRERTRRINEVYDLINRNHGHLPDDYDILQYPHGAERWYVEDLLERRRLRAEGKEPPKPDPDRFL